MFKLLLILNVISIEIRHKLEAPTMVESERERERKERELLWMISCNINIWLYFSIY